MSATITAHAAARVRQRGFRERDISVLLLCGSNMEDGTLMMTDRDVEREIEARRKQIALLERLRGMTAVVAGGSVVTVYRNTRRYRRCRAEPGER
jgi:hypothetical protein